MSQTQILQRQIAQLPAPERSPLAEKILLRRLAHSQPGPMVFPPLIERVLIAYCRQVLSHFNH